MIQNSVTESTPSVFKPPLLYSLFLSQLLLYSPSFGSHITPPQGAAGGGGQSNLHSLLASFTRCSQQFMTNWRKNFFLKTTQIITFSRTSSCSGDTPNMTGLYNATHSFIWLTNRLCFWPFTIIKNLIPNDCERKCESNFAGLTSKEPTTNTNQQFNLQTM